MTGFSISRPESGPAGIGTEAAFTRYASSVVFGGTRAREPDVVAAGGAPWRAAAENPDSVRTAVDMHLRQLGRCSHGRVAGSGATWRNVAENAGWMMAHDAIQLGKVD